MSAFNVVLGCVCALLIILFNISSMARYYMKFTIFIVLATTFTTICMPFMLFRPFNPKNALMPAALLRLTARMLGWNWSVRGLENIDNSSGSVVLINHQSGLDLYGRAADARVSRARLTHRPLPTKVKLYTVLAVIWPLMERCTVVSKRSLQYAAPFGTAAWLWGTVYIDRGAKSARDALNKQTNAIKEDKRKLLLFPEGTRHSGDKLLPFRKGAFHVAVNAGAPIQPVVVSKYHFLDSKRHWFGSGEVIISILPIVESSSYTVDDFEPLMKETYAVMQDEFAKVSAETRWSSKE